MSCKKLFRFLIPKKSSGKMDIVTEGNLAEHDVIN